jgi:hypothetical protein
MSRDRIGDVIVVKTETQQQAFYQLADGTSAFLCAIGLDDYKDPVLRERFFELATEIVLARLRVVGSNVTLVQSGAAALPEANPHASLPCWACALSAADDVRSLLRSSAAADIRLSPSGLPMNCCRVQTVGAFGSRPNASRAGARR